MLRRRHVCAHRLDEVVHPLSDDVPLKKIDERLQGGTACLVNVPRRCLENFDPARPLLCSLLERRVDAEGGSANRLCAEELDTIEKMLCIAITDGERQANVHAKVARSLEPGIAAGEKARGAWIEDRLYRVAGGIARDDDRYAKILERHPLTL